jgi:hypothetical protein
VIEPQETSLQATLPEEQPIKLRDDVARTLGLITLLAFGIALFGLAYSLNKIDSRITSLEATLAPVTTTSSTPPTCVSEEFVKDTNATSGQRLYACEASEWSKMPSPPPGLSEWHDKDAVAGEIVRAATPLVSSASAPHDSNADVGRLIENIAHIDGRYPNCKFDPDDAVHIWPRIDGSVVFNLEKICKGDKAAPTNMQKPDFVLYKETEINARGEHLFDNPPPCDSSRRGQVLEGGTVVSSSGPSWSTFTRMKMCLKSESGKYEWRSMQ